MLTPPISAQLSIPSNNAVTRDKESDAVGPARGGYCSRGARLANRRGELRVGD